MEPKPYSRLSPKRGWSWETPPDPVPEEQIAETLERDVVIVGGGISGLAAGARLGQKGVGVVILDKCAAAGGHGWQIAALDSPVMRRYGKKIDKYEFVRRWLDVSGNQPNEDMLWLFVNNSPKVIDWLLETIGENVEEQIYSGCFKGPVFGEYEGTHHLLIKEGSSFKNRGGGPLLIEVFERDIEKHGNLILRNTKAHYLEKDGTGRVTGVIVSGEDGVYRRWKGKRAVVLATGDIGGDEELLEAFCPVALTREIDVFWPKTSNGGDGHKMAYWAGAAFDDAPWAPVMHNHPYGRFDSFYLHVNSRGKRFMNEDTWMQAKSIRISMQPEPCWAFAVFDAKWLDEFGERFPLIGGQGAMPLNMAINDVEWDPDCGLREQVQEYIDNGKAFTAETLEELADKMGVPRENLLATVARYNELCAMGDDVDFGKRSELLTTVEKPPFIAVKMGASLLDVMGGCLTNTELNILDAEFRPIPGLYAIGNCCGGMYGVDYPLLLNGNSYGRAFSYAQVLGRVLSGIPDEEGGTK
ncbi:MAG: FAD-binding protein [Oscillospiraceae bacterium]|nr:FAD-binding protein [Oscillospiraceae bacterium]